MKIKKYIASSVQEAMINMKNDLGNKGVVLSSRTVKKPGFLGMFKKPDIEIIAGYDDMENQDDSFDILKDELEELKTMISKLPNEPKEKQKINEKLRPYNLILVRSGIDPSISFRLLKELESELNLKESNDDDIKKLLKVKLKILLGDASPIEIGNQQKVVFFVGPTGVGKTTTLAKIASSLVMEQKYNIGLITSDTYRVGAIEQLKTYSDILNLPLEVAYDYNDMSLALEKLSDKDIIFVDTAGRNHNSKEQIYDLEEILKIDKEKEVYLLISSTSDIKTLENLSMKYNFLENYKIIVTKLDESMDFGNIINIRYIFDKRISYYTEGQNVPEDISVMDSDYIIKTIIEGK